MYRTGPPVAGCCMVAEKTIGAVIISGTQELERSFTQLVLVGDVDITRSFELVFIKCLRYNWRYEEWLVGVLSFACGSV